MAVPSEDAPHWDWKTSPVELSQGIHLSGAAQPDDIAATKTPENKSSSLVWYLLAIAICCRVALSFVNNSTNDSAIEHLESPRDIRDAAAWILGIVLPFVLPISLARKGLRRKRTNLNRPKEWLVHHDALYVLSPTTLVQMSWQNLSIREHGDRVIIDLPENQAFIFSRSLCRDEKTWKQLKAFARDENTTIVATPDAASDDPDNPTNPFINIWRSIDLRDPPLAQSSSSLNGNEAISLQEPGPFLRYIAGITLLPATVCATTHFLIKSGFKTELK